MVGMGSLVIPVMRISGMFQVDIAILISMDSLNIAIFAIFILLISMMMILIPSFKHGILMNMEKTNGLENGDGKVAEKS